MATEAVSAPVSDVEAKQVTKKATKSAGARKPKAAKTPAAHPTYLQMIVEAISALKERTGSSQVAIAKFVEEKYKTGLPPNFKKLLSVQLKNLTKNGKLVQVKHSFKLSEGLKKPAAKKPAKVVEKKKKVAAPSEGKKKKVAAPAKPKVKSVKAASAAKAPKKEAKKAAPKAKVAVKKAAKPKAPAPAAKKKVAAAPAAKKKASTPKKKAAPKAKIPAAKKKA